MKQLFIILSVIVFATACRSGKESAKNDKNPKPTWVESLPYSSSYYQAVGSTRKLGSAQNYRAQARDNALALMAGQVNANISSTSILHQVEDRTGVSETLINLIKSQSDEMLEGYEFMGQWEDEYNYYEYYRLSKSKFAEVKAKRKRDAVSRAQVLYGEGCRFYDESKLYQAFSRFVQALDVMASYLGDNDDDEIEGVNPARQSLERINDMVKEVNIESVTGDVTAVKGSVVDDSQISFLITDKAQIVQTDIPLHFSYTGGYLRKETSVSNIDGRAGGAIHQTAMAGNYRFCASIDVKQMVTQSTQNLLVRKLLLNLQGNSSCVKVAIQ